MNQYYVLPGLMLQLPDNASPPYKWHCRSWEREASDEAICKPSCRNPRPRLCSASPRAGGAGRRTPGRSRTRRLGWRCRAPRRRSAGASRPPWQVGWQRSSTPGDTKNVDSGWRWIWLKMIITGSWWFLWSRGSLQGGKRMGTRLYLRTSTEGEKWSTWKESSQTWNFSKSQNWFENILFEGFFYQIFAGGGFQLTYNFIKMVANKGNLKKYENISQLSDMNNIIWHIHIYHIHHIWMIWYMNIWIHFVKIYKSM